jgi:PPK2 family polyphosphate:nucleotide phosphotransferase
VALADGVEADARLVCREREANPTWASEDVEHSVDGVAAADRQAMAAGLRGELAWDLAGHGGRGPGAAAGHGRPRPQRPGPGRARAGPTRDDAALVPGWKGHRMAKRTKAAARVSDLLRVPAGPVDLSALDTRATPGFDGDKAAGKAELAALGRRLSDLQERLHAEGVKGGSRSLLLVLQGLDTSGKGGVLRHVIGQVDPQGCEIASFKAPTREELAHDFLWRIRRRLPGPGKLGVFDRSHYEDVLVVRVHDLVPRSTWSRRYASINRFEAGLVERDIRVVKVFLHISKEEQRQRLLARLDDPTKLWKFNPRDVDERAFWPDYQQAYETALERCNTDLAPWYRVPADRKWYRNWAIASLLAEQLEDMKLTWPKADFDVTEQRARLTADA